MPDNKKILVVIGAGAAGFFCAVNAARMNSSMKVIILEKTSKILSKVRVSGGGRCNVTHACFEIEEMSRRYPRGSRFVKKSFHQFFTTDTIEWFEHRGVQLKTEKDGRMFPVSNSSQTIIDCLAKEAEKFGVEIRYNVAVEKIEQQDEGFMLTTANGQPVYADNICIACGGFPKTAMFGWLTATGHTIAEPVPSLFTFNMPGNKITELMGVSVEAATVKIAGTKLEQEGPLLITHWGMSGPAILKLSAWGARELATRNWQFEISINWVDNLNEQQLAERFQQLRFEMAAVKMSVRNPFALPQRLWEYLLTRAGITNEKRWADLSSREQNALIRLLCNCPFEVRGKTTFKEEFVTAGGINIAEVEPHTMMSKKIPGVFFAGEILDVDGITGGYNFQHAWTSGFIAASAIAARVNA